MSHTTMSRTTTLHRCAGAVLGATAVVALAACGPASSTATPPSAAPSSAAPVTVVATSGDVFNSPLDAVPASDGSATWFTASGPDGPGVFVTTAATTRLLATGAPFRAPRGLTLTADDHGLLIADPEADAVFAEPVTGGTPTELIGTRGLHPRGVEVVGTQLYLTGIDPASGTGAVFVLPVTGGAPSTIATGLDQPDGITVGPDGAVLVTEAPGSVLRLRDGTVQRLATDVRLGAPAGLTLTADGSTLLVSSLNAATGTAQVLALDPATGHRFGVFDDIIGANTAAGGAASRTPWRGRSLGRRLTLGQGVPGRHKQRDPALTPMPV